MKRIFAITLVLTLAFSLVACGGGSSALAGKWVPENGPAAPSGFPDNPELLKDGTGVDEGLSLKWTAENGRLILSFDAGMGVAYAYKVSGATLALTNDDGASVRYKKEK